MDPNNDTLLLEPYEYLETNPGKDFRTKLIQAFNNWIHVPLREMKMISEIISMLHTASLLVDDVEDSSELRRGAPVAHKIFGVASTINSANFVYFLALEKTLALQKSCNGGGGKSTGRPMEIFTLELLQLHRGQGHEIRWRDTVSCPSEEQYLEMVSNKTGGLLRLAVKLMQECGTTDVDYVPLVDILGTHFQIRDDYINLKSSKYMATKGFAEDITEGKFSFPIVHCIHHNPSTRSRLENILRQRTTDPDVKRYAIGLLEESGSLEYTRRYLVAKEKEARDTLSELGGNQILEEMLSFLAKEYMDV